MRHEINLWPRREFVVPFNANVCTQFGETFGELPRFPSFELSDFFPIDFDT